MTEVRRESRGKKGGKRKGKEFMDAALDAFVRDQALRKWREVDGLMSGAGIDEAQAIRDTGDFLDKGPYGEIWRRHWELQSSRLKQSEQGGLFAGIEEAVRGAVFEERVERIQRRDNLLEDTPPYKEFVARAMEQLLGEAAGDIEEL